MGKIESRLALLLCFWALGFLFPGCATNKEQISTSLEKFQQKVRAYDFDGAWEYLDFLYQKSEWGSVDQFRIWGAGMQWERKLPAYYNIEVKKVELLEETKALVTAY